MKEKIRKYLIPAIVVVLLVVAAFYADDMFNGFNEGLRAELSE